MEQLSDPRVQSFLTSLELIEDAIAGLRSAIEILNTSIARTRVLLAAGHDPFELLAAPGTISRDTTIEALNAMHSALMVSRGEWYRILIEGKGMSLSEIARHTGHPRQLIKRRYDAVNEKRAKDSDRAARHPNAPPDDA